MAAIGWLGAAIPEQYGGAGLGYEGLCVLAEELGRAVAPVPFASSAYLATEALLLAGTDAQKRRLLPKLAEGSVVGCFALAEGTGNPDPAHIRIRATGGRLTGSKWPVMDGDIADFAVVVARDDGGEIALFLADLTADGVSRRPLTTIDPSRDHARIDFAGAAAERLGAQTGWPRVQRLLERAAILVAFEQVGGAQASLEMARDYALERYAFGRPIGSFQAIKHKLADVYVAIELARSNAYYGAWALSAERPNCRWRRRPRGCRRPRRSISHRRSSSRPMAGSASPGTWIATCTTDVRSSLRWRSDRPPGGSIGWSNCWKCATRHRRRGWTSTIRQRKPHSVPRHVRS
jgi:alkylation response protein AidB-like acyl-CoA dehydrogenase